MGSIAFGILSILGLLGFVGAMCAIVYLFWRRPRPEEHLPDGQYHIHFMGTNKKTGAPIYDVQEISEDKTDDSSKQS